MAHNFICFSFSFDSALRSYQKNDLLVRVFLEQNIEQIVVDARRLFASECNFLIQCLFFAFLAKNKNKKPKNNVTTC